MIGTKFYGLNNFSYHMSLMYKFVFKGVRPKNVVNLLILNKLIEYIFQYFQIMKKFRSKMMIFVLNDQKTIIF